MIELLAGKYKNICVVGDDDQSIYKFRGANIENILNFEKTFPGAKVIRLEQNYRSTKTILNAANAVIRNNTKRKDKSLWTENEEGEPIPFYFVDNPYVESDRIIRKIKEYLKDGYNLNDCACLYRTNAQSRALEEAFIRENLPYKIVGGVNFYQRKEIKDILAYLKTIDNGKDDVAVKRIINEPKRGIGASAVNLVQSVADDRRINFYAALESGIDEGMFGRAEEKLRSFRDIIGYLQYKSGEVTLTELMDEVLERTGYLRELRLENTIEAQTRMENIDELVNKVSSYQEAHENPTLSGFLEEVSLVADIDSWDAADSYVSLITVHSAKGLEFPNVFLCGMEDGLFPMNAATDPENVEDLEEERRLAYVAITRAKKNLVITAAKMRMVRGETMVSKQSRFVDEIPKTLLAPDRENTYISKPKMDFEPRSADSGKAVFATKPYAQMARQQFEVKSGGLDYGVGDMVSHMKFGKGVVTCIDEGGRDYEVTVDFENFGTKKMFAAFAKLKKL